LKRIYNCFFGKEKKAEDLPVLDEALKSLDIEDFLIQEGEVILRPHPDGTYTVLSLKKLTPEQAIMLSRGEIPEGIDRVLRLD